MADGDDTSFMINVRKAESEAAAWGIALLDWMELQVHIHGNVDPFGNPDLDDEPDEDERGTVAQVLIENNLAAKANRFLECSRYAYLYQCQGPEEHQLFSPIYCDLRFCPRCAPRQFARLIEKYVPVVEAIADLRIRGFRFRELTFTTRNTGSLSAPQIKEFNGDVKTTLKILMDGAKNWGAIWCDEVGFNNTNLHAHALFYGPYITQRRLAEIWKEVSGHEVVYIAKADRSPIEALIHLLKYVSKPPASDPRQIGLLEVAFHGTRRVHTVGSFYNFAGKDSDNQNSEWTKCPHCGSDLKKLPGTVRIEKAILDGRTFIGTKQTARRKEWVN